MGRPMKVIDEKQFESLCGLQCTLAEIADFFECSEDTVERWCKRTYGESFADTFNKRRGKGKVSLRRAQFRLAEKSAAMAIWLGKQYLGQIESPASAQEKQEIEDLKPLADLLGDDGDGSHDQ